MNKLVGMAPRKTGVYEGMSYDNVVFYYISDESIGISGCVAGELKVKFGNLASMFGSDKSNEDFYGSDVVSFIDKYVKFSYSMIGKHPVLSGISIAEPPVKSKTA